MMNRLFRPICLTLCGVLLLSGAGVELGHHHFHSHVDSLSSEGHGHDSHCTHHHGHSHHHHANDRQDHHPAPCHDENDCSICRHLFQSATTIVFAIELPAAEPVETLIVELPIQPCRGSASFQHSRAPPENVERFV